MGDLNQNVPPPSMLSYQDNQKATSTYHNRTIRYPSVKPTRAVNSLNRLETWVSLKIKNSALGYKKVHGVGTFSLASGAISSPSTPGSLPTAPKPSSIFSQFLAGPFQDRSCDMQFFIISFKARVP